MRDSPKRTPGRRTAPGKRPAPAPVAPPAGAGARRAPVQERGRRRVELLLDAAAEAIADVGVDNVTTNAIAARANTSVGLLYKFFPNKEALVQALAQRYVEAFDDLLRHQEEHGIARWPLGDAIAWAVGALMAFHEEHPAFQHVYRATRSASASGGAALLDQTKRVLGHLLALRTPTVKASDREVHATVAVEVAQALVVHAMSVAPRARRRLARETIALLTRYLEPEYGSAAPAVRAARARRAPDTRTPRSTR